MQWAHRFVEFFGWFETSKTVFIAMEYFPLGDLEQYVKQKGSFDVRAVQTITDQLLGGLVAMHKHDFTHRDLKPQVCLTGFPSHSKG
jgi:serine/threonine protein kinase